MSLGNISEALPRSSTYFRFAPNSGGGLSWAKPLTYADFRSALSVAHLASLVWLIILARRWRLVNWVSVTVCELQKQACGQRSAQIDWLPWNRLTSHNRCPRAFWQVTIAPSDPVELLVGRRGLWLWVNTCEGVCCCWLSACKFVNDSFRINNIF